MRVTQLHYVVFVRETLSTDLLRMLCHCCLLSLIRIAQLDAQLSSAAAATQSAEAEAARLAAALQQQATEAAAAAEQAAAALASEKAAAAAAAAKARGDQLVLAKEVQRLRGELSKANQVRCAARRN